MGPTERGANAGKGPAQAAESADGESPPVAPTEIYTIFEGTSEIQRLVIARTLSGMPIR